jgi:hypothetical protein
MKENKPIWWKPGIKATGAICACCAQTTELLSLDTVLYDGFGGWSVTKNGQYFFQADQGKEWDETETLKDIENMIGEDNESEYLANLFTPLRGATFQRHAKNHWVLIETNEGFA